MDVPNWFTSQQKHFSTSLEARERQRLKFAINALEISNVSLKQTLKASTEKSEASMSVKCQELDRVKAGNETPRQLGFEGTNFSDYFQFDSNWQRASTGSPESETV